MVTEDSSTTNRHNPTTGTSPSSTKSGPYA
jgi:hypothetical protein